MTKSGKSYYGFSGDRRTNLAFRNNIPINFWVIQTTQNPVKTSMVRRIVSKFLQETIKKCGGYDRELLKPGYKGKFVIQEHDADRAGKHWDIRIEMPVTSKEESVYRSFVDKKTMLPVKNKKIFL